MAHDITLSYSRAVTDCLVFVGFVCGEQPVDRTHQIHSKYLSRKQSDLALILVGHSPYLSHKTNDKRAKRVYQNS